MTPPPPGSEPGGSALPVPPAHPRRLVFLGTPAIAVPALQALVDAGLDVALVVTGPDKRRGRRAEPTPTPVKAAAVELGLPVGHDLAAVPSVGADLGVVVAYGQILRRPLLEELPMVNLHFSLLPRWRGAAPVERAIMAGDDRTGVCVMAVEEGLDTGGVYARAELPITRTATAVELSRQLAGIGAALLARTLREGLGAPEPQLGEPVYAHKIGPDDLELHWDRPAEDLDRIVRVGGAWTTRDGVRLKVHRARPWPREQGAGGAGALHGDRVTTGAGTLQLVEVQPEGKARVAFPAWANGARPVDGERLGSSEGHP